MDKTPQEIEAIYAEYEKLGEKKVRMNRETGKYGEASGNMALSKLWLEQKDRDRLNNTKEPWHKTLWGAALIALAIGLSVAGLSYLFGWR